MAPFFGSRCTRFIFFVGGGEEGAGRGGAAPSDTAVLLQTTAVICQDYSHNPSHWNANKTLSQVWIHPVTKIYTIQTPVQTCGFEPTSPSRAWSPSPPSEVRVRPLQWLKENNVPGMYGVDTRALTKKLRVHGSMKGKIVMDEDVPLRDPNQLNLVAEVSKTRRILV